MFMWKNRKRITFNTSLHALASTESGVGLSRKGLSVEKEDRSLGNVVLKCNRDRFGAIYRDVSVQSERLEVHQAQTVPEMSNQ